MPSYEVLEPVEINGVDLKGGMRVTLKEEDAKDHLEKGTLRIVPDAAKPEPTYSPTVAPTVGRIVYYKSGKDCAAMVVGIAESGALDLLVAYASGWTPKHGIVQGQEEGQWDWMPFQKDQQARLAK